MVRLSGLSLIDKNNPNGEIKILITGLRPGEKLYEELLISDKSVPSENTNIFYANEEFIRSLARTRGVQINTHYAEAFQVIRWLIK